MTRTDLLTDLRRLEQLFDASIIVTREVISPVYDDPNSGEPTGWRVTNRITHIALSGPAPPKGKPR